MKRKHRAKWHSGQSSRSFGIPCEISSSNVCTSAPDGESVSGLLIRFPRRQDQRRDGDEGSRDDRLPNRDRCILDPRGIDLLSKLNFTPGQPRRSTREFYGNAFKVGTPERPLKGDENCAIHVTCSPLGLS